MKYAFLIIFELAFTLITAQKGSDTLYNKTGRTSGKGNSTYIPSIANNLRILNNGTTIKQFEKCLPSFEIVIDSSASPEYGIAQEKPSYGVAYRYIINKDNDPYSIDILTSKTKPFNIYAISIEFTRQPKFIFLPKDLIKLGYSYNTELTKLEDKITYLKNKNIVSYKNKTIGLVIKSAELIIDFH